MKFVMKTFNISTHILYIAIKTKNRQVEIFYSFIQVSIICVCVFFFSINLVVKEKLIYILSILDILFTYNYNTCRIIYIFAMNLTLKKKQ